MRYFTIFNADGKVRKIVGGAEGIDFQPHPKNIPTGGTAVEGRFPAKEWYYNGSAPEKKPEMNCVIDKTTVTAGGVDVCVISGLPNPCRIRIDEEVTDVNDGQAEISFDVAGTYTVICEQFPYLDWKVEINAN
jgi:hypothetical protein